MTRLVCFEKDGETSLGLLDESEVITLPGYRDLGAWLDSGTSAPWKADLSACPRAPLANVRLRPPLLVPPKVMAVGLNYADHAHEQAKTPPSFPMFFAKGRTCISGPDDPIQLPPGREEIDVEVELVVIIGQRARNLTPDNALSAVFGFTLGNDVSDRKAQRDDKQFYRAKSFESFGPLGPFVVPREEFDHRKGSIRLWRNDFLQQEADLSQVIFSVERLVSELSIIHTLEPGDLIYTGTPSGVGAHRNPPVFLQSGDRIRCQIEGLGELVNPVIR